MHLPCSNMFKKSQAFYLDFLIGLLILIVITFIFTRAILDINTREDRFQELLNDGITIANSFMSEGYCASYGCDTAWSLNPPVGRLGFIRDGKILGDKFNAFAGLLNNGNYEKTKTLLGTKNDYVLYFEFNDNKLTYGGRNVYGKYTDTNSIDADNVIKLTRIVYYNLDGSGKIVNMVVIVF